MKLTVGTIAAGVGLLLASAGAQAANIALSCTTLHGSSISVKIDGSRWSVGHSLPNGTMIRREAQYQIFAQVEDSGSFEWQGDHRKNHGIRIVGTLKPAEPGRYSYTERIYDEKHGGKQVASVAATCGPVGSPPTVSAAAPIDPSSLVPTPQGFLAMRGVVTGLIEDDMVSFHDGESSTLVYGSEKVPSVQDTAINIWRKYQGNVLAADKAYLGNFVAITGRVISVSQDGNGKAYVRFVSSPYQSSDVMAFLDDSELDRAAGYEPGNEITLHCMGGGIAMGSPVFRACSSYSQRDRYIKEKAATIAEGLATDARMPSDITSREGDVKSDVLVLYNIAKMISKHQACLANTRGAECKKISEYEISHLKSDPTAKSRFKAAYQLFQYDNSFGKPSPDFDPAALPAGQPWPSTGSAQGTPTR